MIFQEKFEDELASEFFKKRAEKVVSQLLLFFLDQEEPSKKAENILPTKDSPFSVRLTYILIKINMELKANVFMKVSVTSVVELKEAESI